MPAQPSADDVKGQKSHIDDTEVTPWLRKNGANEALVNAFYKRGYRSLEALEDDDIDEMVTQPGLRKELKLALKRYREQKAEAARKPEEKKPLTPPTLPKDKTFDLSQQTLKFDNVEYTMPTTLSVDTVKDAKLADQLCDRDWIVLAKRSNILSGYLMSTDPEARPVRPVLYWKVPRSDRFYDNEAWHARTWTEVTYTYESASYVRAGFDTESATTSYVFCSASFERTHNERTAQAQAVRRCHMTGHYRFPRATLHLAECTTVSKEFVKDVRAALAADDKAAALGKVLNTYGYAVPREVLLGGELLYTSTSEAIASAGDRQVEYKFSLAVTASGKGLTGDAGASSGSAQRDSNESQRQNQTMSFDVIGGQTLYDANPAQWVPTLADPLTWAVIGKSNLISTLDLLPQDLRDQAKSYWKPKIPFPERQTGQREDENVQAVEAGFLSAMIEVPTDAGDAALRAYGGRGADPREVRAVASVHFFKNTTTRRSGLLLPVPKGEFWRVGKENSAGDTGESLFFQPVPFGMGEWVSFQAQADEPGALALNQTCRCEQDGFVIVTVNAIDNGTWGTVVARQAMDDGPGAPLTEMIGASLHYSVETDIKLRGASLLMPVRRNHDFRLDVRWENQSRVRIGSWWVPLQTGWRIGAIEPRQEGKINEAEENGMLIGHLIIDESASGDVLTNIANLLTSNAEAALDLVDRDGSPTLRLTQASAEATGVRQAPTACLAAIVRKGERYRGTRVRGQDNSRLPLFWAPFEQE